MRTSLVIGFMAAFLGSGCSQTNIAEYAKALASDPNPWCVIANAGPYGGVTVGRGSPNVKVAISGGSCSLEGLGGSPGK